MTYKLSVRLIIIFKEIKADNCIQEIIIEKNNTVKFIKNRLLSEKINPLYMKTHFS